MALLDCESFGSSPNTADFASYPYGDYGPTVPGPFRDPCLPGAADYRPYTFYRPFLPAISAGFVGMRVSRQQSQSGTPSQNIGLLCATTAQPQASLRVTSTGIIVVTRGNASDAGGTVLFTSNADVIPRVGWHLLEWGWAIDPAAGSFEVRVNGAVLVSMVNQNTRADGASNQVNAVQVNGNLGMTGYTLCDASGPGPDNTFLGDVRVRVMLAQGPGDNTAFTPVGAPTNWEVAASAPLPATRHNDSNAVGALDLFTTGGLPATTDRIVGVRIVAQLQKNDGGNRTMATVIKAGGVTSVGAARQANAVPFLQADVVRVNPATGAPWTPAAVNSAQFGYTIVS